MKKRNTKAKLMALFSALLAVCCLSAANFLKAFADDSSDYLSYSEDGPLIIDIDLIPGGTNATAKLNLIINSPGKYYRIHGKFAETEEGGNDYFSISSIGRNEKIIDAYVQEQLPNGIFDYKYPSAGDGVEFEQDEEVFFVNYTVNSDTPAGCYSLPITIDYVQKDDINLYEENKTVYGNICVEEEDEPWEPEPELLGASFDEWEVEKYYGDSNFTNAAYIDTSLGYIDYYYSENEDVATVNSETGEVTIVGVGQTSICAENIATDPDYESDYDCYTLYVYEEPEIVFRDGDEEIAEYWVEDWEPNFTITAEIVSGEDHISIDGYYSTDEDVATVDSETGEVSIGVVGTTRICVSITSNPPYNDTFCYTLYVEEPEPELLGASFDEWEVEKYYGDSNFTNLAHVDANLGYIGNYWSEDEDIAIVDEDSGEVTIIGAGQTNICADVIATELGYEGSDDCYTLVVNQADLYTFFNGDITKTYGDSNFTNLASIDSSLGYISRYSSDNENIAIVDENSGEVTIVGVGTTYIYAHSQPTNSNYRTNSGFYKLTVHQKEISSDNISLSESSFTYDGTEKRPDVSVVINGNIIDSNNYTVEYPLNMIDANESVAITVSGQNNLSGTATVYYGIAPAESPDPVELTTDFVAEAGETLSVLGERTNGFVWCENSSIMAGLNEYCATYTYEGSSNYTTKNLNVPVYGLSRIDIATSVDGGHGSISESQENVLERSEVVIIFTPDEGYEIASVEVNGVDVTDRVSENRLTLTAGIDDITVSVSYAPRQYTLSISGQHATFSPSEAVVLDYGSTRLVEIAADEGYFLRSVLVNGEEYITEEWTNSLSFNVTIDGDVEIIIVTDQMSYEIVDADGLNHVIGNGKSVSLHLDADYSLFEEGGQVYIDDELVDPKNYTSSEGSIRLTLLSSYVDTLSVGTHTLRIALNNGRSIRTSLVVEENNNESEGNNTGEDGNEGGEDEGNGTNTNEGGNNTNKGEDDGANIDADKGDDNAKGDEDEGDEGEGGKEKDKNKASDKTTDDEGKATDDSEEETVADAPDTGSNLTSDGSKATIGLLVLAAAATIFGVIKLTRKRR